MKSLLNIFRLKCLVCHKGELLQTQPIFFFKLIRVRESCTNCKTRFKLESAFTVVYVCFLSFGSILMMATTLIYWLWSNPFSILYCFLWTVGVVLIFNSYINALSKLIWANFSFKYNSKLEQSED